MAQPADARAVSEYISALILTPEGESVRAALMPAAAGRAAAAGAEAPRLSIVVRDQTPKLASGAWEST
jgi:hypothetical protein